MADPNAVIVANPDLTAAVVQISSFLSHLTVSGATAHVIEFIKNRPLGAKFWALLDKRTKTVVGAIAAGIASLGITATFQHDPHAPAGVYTVILTGLTGPSILQHLWSFVQSWLLQQGWYLKYLKPTPITGVEPSPRTGTGSGHVEPPPPPVVVTEVHP